MVATSTGEILPEPHCRRIEVDLVVVVTTPLDKLLFSYILNFHNRCSRKVYFSVVYDT